MTSFAPRQNVTIDSMTLAIKKNGTNVTNSTGLAAAPTKAHVKDATNAQVAAMEDQEVDEDEDSETEDDEE